MERIELFDNYINNQLSDAQRSEFDAKLKSDEDFASEFKVYLMTVDGICREAHQDNMDFGVAMKKLTKEQLREIIGPRHEEMRGVAASMPEVVAAKPKVFHFMPWMWQAASIAAVVVIAFVAVFRVEQNARNSVYDTIYACASINDDYYRGANTSINLDGMSDRELENLIPTLKSHYQSSESESVQADNGYILALVYLKLHDANSAKEILSSLINKHKDDIEYADDIKKWEGILTLIEK